MPVFNSLTRITSKDVNRLQPTSSLRWCQRQLQSVRDAYGIDLVLVKHLASFWQVSESEIITALR